MTEQKKSRLVDWEAKYLPQVFALGVAMVSHLRFTDRVHKTLLDAGLANEDDKRSYGWQSYQSQEIAEFKSNLALLGIPETQWPTYSMAWRSFQDLNCTVPQYAQQVLAAAGEAVDSANRPKTRDDPTC